MDYRVASDIRGKSLSSMMTDNITSGKGIGSSLSGAISSKFKASATGIKEKFDPMNIAKFMTGGSRLAPAILGKLTGRSQSDINYFAGDKNKGQSYTQMPSSMPTPGGGLGGSAVEVLNRMLAFLQSSREKDTKRKDTAKQFMEEQKVEEQRRHNEFLKVLQEYTSLGSTTLMGGSAGGTSLGIIDTIKSMIESALAGFAVLKPLLKFAGNIVKFVASPLFKVLLNPYVLGFATAYTLAKYLASILPDYTKISPEEAKNALENGSERDIGKLGGREYLQTIINDYNNNLNAGETPVTFTPQTETQLRNVPPRPDTTGGKNQPRAMNWDRNYGETHNPDGTPKVTTTANVEESTAGAGPGNAVLDDYMARQLENDYMARQLEQETGGKAAFGVKPMGITPKTTTPVPAAPASTRMNDAVSENQNLNLESYGSGSSGSAAPVISSSSSSVDLPDRPIPATATVRDTTPILAHVMQGYLSPV